MRIFFLALLFSFLPSAIYAQIPPIGIIDFYGLRNISAQQARAALQLKEGDSLPNSREEAEKRLISLTNVEQAKLTFACCDDLNGQTILYVGIREKGSPILRFRPPPTGTIRLPIEMIKANDALSDAIERAVIKGDIGEDDSQGYALSVNAEARAIQLRFITFAAHHLKLLRTVLRESSNASQRALAVEIIAYTNDKGEIINDLVYGINDADGGVRNNSLRALGVIARFSVSNPEKKIDIPIKPLVEMLDSIEWSDRNKSLGILDLLTRKRDKILFAELRKSALPALSEMARWKNPGHAVSAFFILGRVSGLTDVAIQKIWTGGNREELFKRIENRLK